MSVWRVESSECTHLEHLRLSKNCKRNLDLNLTRLSRRRESKFVAKRRDERKRDESNHGGTGKGGICTAGECFRVGFPLRLGARGSYRGWGLRHRRGDFRGQIRLGSTWRDAPHTGA